MLQIDDLCVSYDGFTLNNVNMHVQPGDYYVLLGPSGAGKSVVMESVAGLIRPDSGTIMLDGRDVTRLPSQRRAVGMVFQDYALFPHMRVWRNIAYGLVGQTGKTERNRLVRRCADDLSIAHLLQRMPGTLSGGEQQRVALARALIRGPKVLLLDEPLAAVDVSLKDELTLLLQQLHQQGQTVVHVTHDYQEAVRLATRVGVIAAGRMNHEDTPQEVFGSPRSAFVARLMGNGNFFSANLQHTKQGTVALLEGGVQVICSDDSRCGDGYIIIRSEDIVLSAQPLHGSLRNRMQGTVLHLLPASHGIEVILQSGIRLHSIITHSTCSSMGIEVGMLLYVGWKASAVQFIEAENQ